MSNRAFLSSHRSCPSKVLIATTSFGEFDSSPIHFLEKNGIHPILNKTGKTLTQEELVSLGKECSGVIAGMEKYTAQTFSSLKKLKAISRCGVRLHNIDLETAYEKKIRISTTPNASINSVAELTLGLILNLSRQISNSDQEVKAGIWNKRMGLSFNELTVGLIGLDATAKKLAELLRTLNIRVIACDADPDLIWASWNRVEIISQEALLRRSQILSLHSPHYSSSEPLLHLSDLNQMQAGSYLINTSNENLITPETIIQAIENGRLAGAALDVFNKDPYYGVLTRYPSIVLTPHIGSYAKSSRIDMEMRAAENLLECLKTNPILRPKRIIFNQNEQEKEDSIHYQKTRPISRNKIKELIAA